MALNVRGIHFSEEVISLLPQGSQLLDARRLRPGRTRKVRATVRLTNGKTEEYFVKTAIDKMGRELLAAQALAHASMGERPTWESDRHGRATDMGERPIEKDQERKTQAARKRGTGQSEVLCHETMRTHFVMEFIPAAKVLPEAPDLCAYIAAIHRDTSSPDRRCFGFPTPSYLATFSIPIEWERSWATFFGRMLQRLAETDSEIHGLWLRGKESFELLLSRTVPRLLGALETGNRSIKPCLVHGNLSADQIGVTTVTANPVAFSPSPLYAHNEFELGMWRRKVGMFPRSYFEEYQRHIPPSEPVDQWDDRIRLYSVHFNLAYVLVVPETLDVQKKILEDIDYLNNIPLEDLNGLETAFSASVKGER